MTTQDGSQLDVVVFDRDQQAAGAFYRLYRLLRVQEQVSRNAPLSVDHTVERRALLSYATEGAGVATPRLRTLLRVRPEAAVLAYDHCEGTALAQRNPGSTDAELGRVSDAVTQLTRTTSPTAGSPPTASCSRPTNGSCCSTPATVTWPRATCRYAWTWPSSSPSSRCSWGRRSPRGWRLRRSAGASWSAVLPLLQPVALARSTRKALRHRHDVLPTVRKALLAAVPGGEVTPVQLERIRPRNLVTLVATVAAIYLLAGELARASAGSVLRSADWRWGFVALALSAVTYVGAALSLSGFVGERLNFRRTLLVQLASSSSRW